MEGKLKAARVRARTLNQTTVDSTVTDLHVAPLVAMISRASSSGEENPRAQPVASFVRFCGRKRGNEFFETWVTPKRIEHRIEPK